MRSSWLVSTYFALVLLPLQSNIVAGQVISGPVIQMAGEQIDGGGDLPDGWVLQRWKQDDDIYCVIGKGSDPFYVNVEAGYSGMQLTYWETDGKLTSYLLEHQDNTPSLYVELNGFDVPFADYSWDPGVISVTMDDEMTSRFASAKAIVFSLDGTDLTRTIQLNGSRNALRELEGCS